MSTNVVIDTPPQTVATGQTVAPGGQQSLTDLVSGILSDAERLIRQQVEMVRAEFKEDLRHTKEAAMALGAGVALLAAGGFLLLVAIVYLLNLTALPLWACWAIVGGAVVLIGGAALYAGYRILANNNPLPDKSLNALQENVSWITNPQK